MALSRGGKGGAIVNISSIGGQVTFPLGTLYHGSKFAVEGLSEALHYELEPLGIRVRIVEPGMIGTDFGGRSYEGDEKILVLCTEERYLELLAFYRDHGLHDEAAWVEARLEVIAAPRER